MIADAIIVLLIDIADNLTAAQAICQNHNVRINPSICFLHE